MTIETPPRSPYHDELQALIEEARRRARRRRRRNGIVLAVIALVTAGLYVLVTRLVGRGASGGSRSGTLIAAEQASARRPFWYMRAVTSMNQWLPAGGITMDRRGFSHRHGPEVLFDVRLTEETWVGVDGTMRDRVTAAARFASAGGRATWAGWGQPAPNFNAWLARDAIVVGGGNFPPQLWYPWGEALGPSGLDLGDSLFSYRELLSLPAAPRAALDRVTQAEQALIGRETRTGANTGYETFPGGIDELTDIGGLLAAPIPASTRLALLRAAMRLPGARVSVHARDALGRATISVTSTAGIAMARLTLAPATGALLEGPKGIVVAQGPVGSLYALPHGLSPLRAAGGPPEPSTLAITPRTGHPNTVFMVVLTPPDGRRSRRAPSLDWIVAGTPSARCFAPGFPRPLSASSTIRRAGRFSYLYPLSPPATDLHSWCPGRYELQVVPDYSGRPWRAPLKLTGPPAFSAGSGSSIYFDVS